MTPRFSEDQLYALLDFIAWLETLSPAQQNAALIYAQHQLEAAA